MRLGTHRIGDSRRCQRGASLVEFAIIAPLLLMLIFGIVEMSRAIFAYTSVWSAAREGARFATTVENDNFATCAAIRNAAVAKAVTIDIDPNSDVFVKYVTPSGTTFGCDAAMTDCDGTALTALPIVSSADIVSGTEVEVLVTGTFDSVIPLIEVFLDGLELDSCQRRTIYIGEQVGS